MAVVECGSFSTLFFTNGDEDYGFLVTVDGVQYSVPSWSSFFVPCYGVVNVQSSIPYIAIAGPLPDLHNDYAFSFLWGCLAAFAFAAASVRRWF